MAYRLVKWIVSGNFTDLSGPLNPFYFKEICHGNGKKCVVESLIAVILPTRNELDPYDTNRVTSLSIPLTLTAQHDQPEKRLIHLRMIQPKEVQNPFSRKSISIEPSTQPTL